MVRVEQLELIGIGQLKLAFGGFRHPILQTLNYIYKVSQTDRRTNRQTREPHRVRFNINIYIILLIIFLHNVNITICFKAYLVRYISNCIIRCRALNLLLPWSYGAKLFLLATPAESYMHSCKCIKNF